MTISSFSKTMHRCFICSTQYNCCSAKLSTSFLLSCGPITVQRSLTLLTTRFRESWSCMSITDIFVTETKTKTFAKIKSSQYAIRTCYHILKKLQLTRFQFLLRTECLIVSRESAMRHSAMYHLQCSVVFISNVQIHCRTSGNLTAKWCRRKLDIVPEGTTTSSLCPLLKPTAEDLVTMRASQAFVKRNFSICGLLTLTVEIAIA